MANVTDLNKVGVSTSGELCEVARLLAKLTKIAMIKHIKLCGSWSVASTDCTYAKTDKFDEVVAKAAEFQIEKTRVHSKGGDFDLTITVSGELEKIFRKYGIKTTFTVEVDNPSGDLCDEFSIEEDWLPCVICCIIRKENDDVIDVKELTKEIGDHGIRFVRSVNSVSN